MSVHVAGIHLAEVQVIRSREARRLLTHQLPGFGGVVQDVGRELVAVDLDGYLRGADAGRSLATLQTVYRDGDPVSMEADLLTGTTVAEVMVTGLWVEQVAGYKDFYHYRMALREYVEPPRPASGLMGAVQAAIEAGVAVWAEAAFLAENIDLFVRQILGDPAGAAAVLAEAGAYNQDALDQAIATAAPVLAADPALLDGLLSEPADGAPELLAAVGGVLACEPDQLAAASQHEDGARFAAADPLLTALGAGIVADPSCLIGAVAALDGPEGQGVDAALIAVSREIARDTESAIDTLTGDGAALLDNTRFKRIVAGELVIALDDVAPYRDRVAARPSGAALADQLGAAATTTLEGQFPGVWEPMEVQLLTAEGRLINVTRTDDTGAFRFEAVKPGNYKVSLSGMRLEPTGGGAT